MGKKLATNFLAFGIKMIPSAVLVLKNVRKKNKKTKKTRNPKWWKQFYTAWNPMDTLDSILKFLIAIKVVLVNRFKTRCKKNVDVDLCRLKDMNKA